MAFRDYLPAVIREPRALFAQRKKKVAPTSEVGIADTRLNILNTVTLFPFNPDDLVRQKGGLEVYDRMLQDEQVKAALAFKKAAVIGSGWTITPRGDTPEEQDLATLLEEDIRLLEGTFEDDLWEMLSGFEYGFSISELVWQLDDGTNQKPRKFTPPNVPDPQVAANDLPPTMIGPSASPTERITTGTPRLRLKAIKSKAPHRIDFKVDPYGNIVDIVQLQAWGRFPLPPEKFVHYIHNPNFSNPYGTSDLRAAYKSWFYKTNFLQYWAVWMEMLSIPIPIATYPKNDEDRAASVRAMLAAIQARTAITLPEGWTIAPFESTRDINPFLDSVDRMDMAMARAILVPEKLGLAGGAVAGGSYSLSKTQANTFLMVLQQVSRRLTALVQSEVIDRMAAYAMPGVPAPEFTLNPITDEDRQQLIDLYIKATQQGALIPDLEDENQLRDRLGWPKREVDGPDANEPWPLGGQRKVPSPVPMLPTGMGTPAAPGGGSTVTGRGQIGVTASPAAGTMKASEFPKPAEAEKLNAALPTDFWRKLHPLEVRADMTEKRDTLETLTSAMTTALATGAKALVEDIAKRAKKLVGQNPNTVRTLKPSAKVMAELRGRISALLQHSYARATQQAKAEIRRAKRQDYTEADMRADFQAGLVGSKADQLARAQAFQVTDVLSQDILQDAQQVLLSTLTHDKTTRQIEFELDQALADYLPEFDAAGRAVNVPARIETIARTNVARFVNEARYAVFTDPALDGFVSAFRYTAVLDSRTRPNHRAWDGVTLAVDDPHWYGPPDERPPNGFNCRCTLIPVTTADRETLTPAGQIPGQPAADEGFK